MLAVITSTKCEKCNGAGKVRLEGRFTRLFRFIPFSCAHCDGQGYRTVTEQVPDKPRTERASMMRLRERPPPRVYGHIRPPDATLH
jgi:hypothetical protein